MSHLKRLRSECARKSVALGPSTGDEILAFHPHFSILVMSWGRVFRYQSLVERIARSLPTQKVPLFEIEIQLSSILFGQLACYGLLFHQRSVHHLKFPFHSRKTVAGYRAIVDVAFCRYKLNTCCCSGLDNGFTYNSGLL